MKKKWYNWPEGYYNNSGLVPWYVILRRLVFYPVLLAGAIITYIGIFCAFGYDEAKRFWKTF